MITKYFFLVLIYFFLFTFYLWAITAAPPIITFEQPDGIKYPGFLKGDEYYNWIQTKNEEVVVQNQSTNFFEF